MPASVASLAAVTGLPSQSLYMLPTCCLPWLDLCGAQIPLAARAGEGITQRCSHVSAREAAACTLLRRIGAFENFGVVPGAVQREEVRRRSGIGQQVKPQVW